jgi:nucleotide-binding universal stress UspA family protein
MKILAAVDGSSYTKRMLAYLSAHDEWLGTHHAYTLVNVQAAVPARAAAVIDKATLKAYYESESEKVFKPLRPFFAKRGMQADFVSKVGHAAETIAALADKGKFDLVVLGSHGQGSLMNLVMGSVATKVIASSKVPVLLIR